MSVDYNSLNDFDFEDTNMDEVTLKEIRQVQSDIVERLERIENLVSKYGQVNNSQVPKGKAGRKKCKMYYENRLIHDSDIFHLMNEMGLSIAEILNDFFYVDEHNFKIEDRKACRNLISSRLYNARRNML